MALEVEGVVDGGVDAEKPLRGAGRFEALHFSLARSHDLVRSVIAVLIESMSDASHDASTAPAAANG
jgi:hypothetical protein